jgi:hypothetical protein
MKKLTISQILKVKPKDRTYKQAVADEATATHVVSISVEGVGTNIDMDLFRGAGAYSDNSGYGMGERDHEWFVQSEDDAEAVKANLETVMADIEDLNKTKVVFKITVRKK